MSEANFERLQELFLQALDQPESERDAWLAEQCGDDHELRDKVRALLQHDQPTEDPLESGLKHLIGEEELPALNQGPGLHIRCPHCNNPIELVDEAAIDEVACPSCGSSFSMVSLDATRTYPRDSEETIGHFTLNERLGIGAFGAVWKAHDTELDRSVAIKVPRKGQLNREETEQFLREARSAAQLRHPNIVSVHEAGKIDDTVYIVSDLVEGLTLSDWLTGQKPTPHEAAVLCAKIAEALNHAHEAGVIHRDLKPSNVMMDRQNQPHLMDFGLAKREAGEITMTMDGTVLGTPAYMSPEQAKGDSHHVDRRTDVYSMGVILFELLTGQLPFRGNRQMLIHQVLTEEAPSPRKLNANVPKDLETICLKCLEKDPAKRYATAQELADDLSRWLENRPIVARRISAIEKAWLCCKRKPVVLGATATVAVVVAVGSYFAREQNNATRAEELVVGLKKAEIEQVPTAVAAMKDFRRWVDPILKKQIAESRDGSGEKLRLSLALLPQDKTQVVYLQSELLSEKGTAAAVPVIRDALQPHSKAITASLWQVLEDNQQKAKSRFNAACALVTFDGENETRWKPVLPFVAGQLVESIQNSLGEAGRFQTMLKPIRAQLSQPISLIVRNTSKTKLQQDIALAVVLDYAKDDPSRLADVLASAERRQYARVFDALKTLQDADQFLAAVLEETWSEESPENEKERIARRQTNAAVALLKLGETTAVWPLLKHSRDPRTRSYIIHWVAPLGVDPQLFVRRFETETDTSIRRALLLTLGEFNEQQLPVAQRQPLLKKLLSIYESDPDPGMHGCAEWLLRKWGHKKSIEKITKKLQANEEQRKAQTKDGKRRWYVNTQGQTYAVLKADVFRMGSPKTETGHSQHRETLHLRKVGRTFAIATYEVTKAQFLRFQMENRTVRRYKIDKYSPTDDSPHVGVNWYDAAAYCNWLSKKEEIPEDQWCYEKNADGKYAAGMKAKKNYLELTGYRLPSEAEWEYACRAGTVTSRYFGLAETLLPQYARYSANGKEHGWPVGGLKPNDFGLFDMLGNAIEWCHDHYAVKNHLDPTKPTPEVLFESPVSDLEERLLRGGSFHFIPQAIRSAFNIASNPKFRSPTVGFRPSRTYPEQ